MAFVLEQRGQRAIAEFCAGRREHPQTARAAVQAGLDHRGHRRNRVKLVVLEFTDAAIPVAGVDPPPHGEGRREALLALIVPVAIFFIAQRVFMRGVVISGVEK